MNPAADDPQIGPLKAEDRDEAFRLILGRLPPLQRQRQLEVLSTEVRRGGPSASDGLLGAYHGGRLVGAVLSQIQPGRTAALWPPRVAQGQPASLAAGLLDTACDLLARQQVCMVQALLSTDASSDATILLQAGFQRLAKLLYLVSTEDKFPSHPPPGPPDFEQYTAANHRRLAAVVEATYDGTLDCPRLNGVRQIEDVLAGYRATSTLDPPWWLVIRHDGLDVGCLLLADHPREGNCELVYMGLAPAGRGHGWAVQITRHAQWLTRQQGRSRLVLAVDAANRPALKAYAAAGFQAWDRRIAYVKVLPPSGQ